MSPSQLALIAVFALAIFAAVWALVPQPDTAPRNTWLEGIAEAAASQEYVDPDELALRRPLAERVFAPLVAALGRSIAKRTKTGHIEVLRVKIVRAGLTRKPETVMATQIFGTFVGAGMGYGFVVLLTLRGVLSIATPVGLALMGYFYPVSAINGKIKKRAKLLRLQLPGVLDLLTISMEAGLSLDAAMLRVCEADHTDLGLEMQKCLNEMRLGRPRSAALLGMADRNDVVEMTTLIRAIVSAEPLGVSIANVLRIQSEDLRRLRRQRAEEAGHRAPVLMLLPMMACIFPCIFIILLGPAAVQVVKSMRGGH